MLSARLVAHPTLTIALLFAAQAANANPAAEKLFQDGRTALTNKEVDKACDAFRASEELEPRVGTLLNLGDCEELRKRVASAWNVFIDARDLATKVKDDRGAKAGRRAKALEPRLPYLTLDVQRVPGLVVQRDGSDVPVAEWDHELPIDPRTYEMTASAPGYKPWSSRIVLVEGQHLHVAVPELVKVEQVVTIVEPPHPPPLEKPVEKIVIVQAPTPPLTEHIGIGVLIGGSDEGNLVSGARLVFNAAPLAGGVVRVVPAFTYAHRRGTDAGQDNDVKTTQLGATLEYAYPLNDRLIAAAGVGAGVDFDVNSYNTPTDITTGFECIRLSPTLRLDRLNISLHYQLGHKSNGYGTTYVSTFEAGLDFFVW
jgi:hypothetical protein